MRSRNNLVESRVAQRRTGQATLARATSLCLSVCSCAPSHVVSRLSLKQNSLDSVPCLISLLRASGESETPSSRPPRPCPSARSISHTSATAPRPVPHTVPTRYLTRAPTQRPKRPFSRSHHDTLIVVAFFDLSSSVNKTHYLTLPPPPSTPPLHKFSLFAAPPALLLANTSTTVALPPRPYSFLHNGQFHGSG